MAKKKFTISRSNFVGKRKHQTIDNGVTIFERDFVTTNDLGGYIPGQTPLYGQGGFKMTIRNGINAQKKYRYGEWLENNTCLVGSDVWTLDCLGVDEMTIDGKIILKPNYNSLLDFVYYGNAVELVRSTINKIIITFPAELYFSDTQIKYINDNGGEETLGGDKYIVLNPFSIDISSQQVSIVDENPLRFMCESYGLYQILSHNNIPLKDLAWDGVEDYAKNPDGTPKTCFFDGEWVKTIKFGDDFKLYTYFLEGEEYTLCDKGECGKKVRPNTKTINKFFSELDDFSVVLLNKNSEPLYSAILETPFDTEQGVLINNKRYTWPSSNGWNLDVVGGLYELFVNDLTSLAIRYDEYYVDNIWRMLTHDSLKTFDIFENNETFDATNLNKILRVYGRQFDDLKRYVDNIKFVNLVTYDNKNNTPNYLLTDVVELDGWDVIDNAPFNNFTIHTDRLYEGENRVYNTIDLNNEILKRLKINSRRILASKGCKSGIEMIMGLFGVSRNQYEIDEFVEVVNGGYKQLKEVELFNTMKNSFYENSFETDETNNLQGLPLREVVVIDSDGSITQNYIIPWFDKNDQLDGNPYFQMKGGWGKTPSKNVNLDLAPKQKKIHSTTDFVIYDETVKYIDIITNINDLLNLTYNTLKAGNLYYVYDITNITSYIEGINPNTASNYFILKNVDLSDEISDNGWFNIPLADIQNGVNDGLKVLYLESIIDVNLGNNPHCGYGSYDGGESYLQHFKQLFKYSIDNNNFNDDGEEQIEDIKQIGFNLVKKIDNKKTWFFSNTTLKNDSFGVIDENGKFKLDTPHMIGVDSGYSIGRSETYDRFYHDYPKKLNTRKIEVEPHNPEGGKVNDEASANSIINVKKLVIRGLFGENIWLKSYFENVINHYIKQIIPSTTILEYEFVDGIVKR